MFCVNLLLCSRCISQDRSSSPYKLFINFTVELFSFFNQFNKHICLEHARVVHQFNCSWKSLNINFQDLETVIRKEFDSKQE